MATYSPEPWAIDHSAFPNSNDTLIRGDTDGDGRRVCRVLCDVGVSTPEFEANLALILAAPAMHRVLTTILKRLDMEPSDAVFPCSAMREDIREVIAAAEGIDAQDAGIAAAVDAAGEWRVNDSDEPKQCHQCLGDIPNGQTYYVRPPSEAMLCGYDCAAEYTKENACGVCLGDMELARECGVRVCRACGNHEGLARCFCGWARNGGNGRAQLEEMGEQIDED